MALVAPDRGTPERRLSRPREVGRRGSAGRPEWGRMTGTDLVVLQSASGCPNPDPPAAMHSPGIRSAERVSGDVPCGNAESAVWMKPPLSEQGREGRRIAGRILQETAHGLYV